MSISNTDIHWNERAASVKNHVEVNIMDIFQRNLEFDYISPYLRSDMRILEVGCGNGYSTAYFRKLVKHVDAFDSSENMIERARAQFGEINNRFFVDNVLSPQNITEGYNSVICVRVLINLQNLPQQLLAIQNMASFLRSGGQLVLVEGFTEGFTQLNKLRNELSLPALEPAKINFYSSLDDVLPILNEFFILKDEFHLGGYDFLTRIVYPQIVGFENVKHNTTFSEKSENLARVYNPDSFKKFSRVNGLVLEKKIE